MSFLIEGGNAKAKNGVEATKVNIKAFDNKQYEAYKKDIIGLVIAVNKKFEETYNEPLFASNELITSAKIFSGSGNSFLKKSKEEYTAVKPKLGDIDVQVDKKKKDWYIHASLFIYFSFKLVITGSLVRSTPSFLKVLISTSESMSEV